MKKKILILTMVTMMTGAAIPVSACTPSYKPVSSQSWYVSLQNALKSAYKAGQNVGANVAVGK